MREEGVVYVLSKRLFCWIPRTDHSVLFCGSMLRERQEVIERRY
jgi:hypothetical protein